jgi:DNA-binding IclR family transcriptional regulator
MATGKRFGIINQEVMHDPGLSLRAKGVYAILCTFADKERMCYPKITTLSELCGVSRRTIERTLVELQTKKHVTREGKRFRIS